MTAKDLWSMIKTTVVEFTREGPLHHGAALSYYALMALVPILYLSISFFGSFVGQETMMDIIHEVLKEQIGIEEVDGILGFLSTVDLAEGSTVLRIFGVLALMLSSTAILNALKRSINEFYEIDRKWLTRKKMIVHGLMFRLISVLSIAAVTSVVIALYFAETFLLAISERYFSDRELISWVFSNFARHGIPVLLNLVIFTMIFKYFHDGVVRWKVAITGGIVTAVFLYLGQLLIKFYLTNYFFGSEGGVAGTMLVILVWVYYSSQILFLGAKFAYVYARFIGSPIVRRESPAIKIKPLIKK